MAVQRSRMMRDGSQQMDLDMSWLGVGMYSLACPYGIGLREWR